MILDAIFRRGEEHPVPGDGQDAAGLHRAPPVPETRHATTTSGRTLLLILDASAQQNAKTAVVTLIDM